MPQIFDPNQAHLVAPILSHGHPPLSPYGIACIVASSSHSRALSGSLPFVSERW
jgi:hypothetical protein